MDKLKIIFFRIDTNKEIPEEVDFYDSDFDCRILRIVFAISEANGDAILPKSIYLSFDSVFDYDSGYMDKIGIPLPEYIKHYKINIKDVITYFLEYFNEIKGEPVLFVSFDCENIFKLFDKEIFEICKKDKSFQFQHVKEFFKYLSICDYLDLTYNDFITSKQFVNNQIIESNKAEASILLMVNALKHICALKKFENI